MNDKQIFLSLYEMEVWLSLANGLAKPDITKSWDNFLKHCAGAYNITLAEMKKDLGVKPPESPAFNFPITSKPEKETSGFYVELSSSSNPDYMHTAQGREEQKGKKIKKHYYKVVSEKEGKAVVEKFREIFELGGGNFPNAPLIWAKNLKLVGEFSFNGRFWAKTQEN